jgi:hypothetical protein
MFLSPSLSVSLSLCLSVSLSLCLSFPLSLVSLPFSGSLSECRLIMFLSVFHWRLLGPIECIRLMDMCTFEQAAREADVAARLAAKRPALGNLTNLPMSAPSPPSSSSSGGASLSSYAVRADPAPTRGRTSFARGRLLVRHCSASRLPISALDGLTNHSFVTSCPLPCRQAAACSTPSISGASNSAAPGAPPPVLLFPAPSLPPSLPPSL